MEIGLKIRELMVQEKLEIPEIAKKLGKTKQAVYDMLEKKDVNTALLRDLSKIFNVPITAFFEESPVSQVSNGNSNVVVGRDNNGSISIKDCQDKLDDALLEIKHLKGEIDGKDKLILEKERLIDVLLNYGPSKNKDLSLTVYSTKGPVKIDILQITNIIPSTGKEKEFVDKINSGSGQEYPCCVIQLGKDSLSVLHDSEYIWQLITEKLSLVLK